MKKRNTYKLFCLTCAGAAWLIFPQEVSAFGFPTWDAGEVINTINGYTTQVQTYSSTVQSTMSVGNIQQAIGDNVGGLEKFKDAKEKVAKEKEKVEKKKRELERKQKLAKKMNQLKDMRDSVKSRINDAKNAYNTAKDIYDEGKNYYEEGKEMYEAGQDLYNTGKDLLGSDEQQNSSNEADTMQDTDLAEMVSDAAFSEGRWDDAEIAVENADSQAPVGTIDQTARQLPADLVARQPFAVKQPMASDAELKMDAAETAKSADVKSLSAMPSVTPVKRELNDMTKPAAVGVQPAAGVRRQTFTTSEKSASYQINMPMAFAQLGGGVKTGYTDMGKFVFSDTLAMECGMGVEDVEEGKVAECVKMWVMGMSDPNAVVAAEWKKKFMQARHDHVTQDLASALTQKSYSAAFQTEVAEDMEKKAEATSNERDQISYNGKVNQTNQEIILRLMEGMTSQLVTDSLQAIERLDRSYYEQDGE